MTAVKYGNLYMLLDADRAELAFQKGLAFENLGNIAAAQKCYQEAIELNPDAVGAWLNLGRIFFNQNNLAEAEKHFRRTIDIDPGYAMAYYNLGVIYGDRGELTSAIEEYEKALALQPSFGNAHFNIAMIFSNTGQTLKAIEHFGSVLKCGSDENDRMIARTEIQRLKARLRNKFRVIHGSASGRDEETQYITEEAQKK